MLSKDLSRDFIYQIFVECLSRADNIIGCMILRKKDNIAAFLEMWLNGYIDT